MLIDERSAYIFRNYGGSAQIGSDTQQYITGLYLRASRFCCVRRSYEGCIIQQQFISPDILNPKKQIPLCSIMCCPSTRSTGQKGKERSKARARLASGKIL